MANNITWHEHQISRAEREGLNGHKGCVIWFTGLSGSGKSTVANVVEQKLYERGIRSFLLDGDNVRYGLNAGPVLLEVSHVPDLAKLFGLGYFGHVRGENIRS